MASGPIPKDSGHLTTEVIERPLMSTEEKTHAVIQQVLGNAAAPYFHNFPGDPRAQWAMIAKCEGGDVIDRDTLGEQAFPLSMFYVHKVTVNGKTPGELVDTVRTVLIDPKGKMVGFVSEGIAKSLARIIQTFGLGPYDPPLNVKVATVKVGGGHKTYAIVPA